MSRDGTRRAFTLIELLVVISIIALLIAVLLPALKQARDTARSVTCLSGIRQIGMGFLLYTHDYHGRYPIADVGLDRVGSNWDNWAFLISDYLADNRDVYRCPLYDGPASNQRQYMTNGTEENAYYGAYAENGGYGIHTLNESQVVRPSESAALIEIWGMFAGLPVYKPDTDIWRLEADAVITMTNPTFNKAPHTNTTTHLFHPDGHASTVGYETTGTLADKYFYLTK